MLDGQEQALVKLDIARKALAAVRSFPDVKKLRDQASAIEHYLKRQQYSLEAIQDAGELKLRAERRLGKLLEEKIRHEGGRPKHGQRDRVLPPDISQTQSKRWQLVAAVPQAEFEEHVALARARQEHLTTAGIVKLAAHQARVEKLVEISRGNVELGTDTTGAVTAT